MTGLGWRTQFITYPSLVFLLSFCFIFYKAPDLTWIRSCVSFFRSYLVMAAGRRSFMISVSPHLFQLWLWFCQRKKKHENNFSSWQSDCSISLLWLISSLLPLPPHSNLTSSWVLPVISDLIICFCCLSTSIFHTSAPETLEPEPPYFTAALSNNYQQW